MNFVRLVLIGTVAFIAGALAPTCLAGEAVGCQGRVVPQSKILKLAAPGDGGTPIIQTLAVEEGDAVKAGQPVAVLLAQKPAQLMLAQAQKRLVAARAELAAIVASEKQAASENDLKRLDAADALASAEAALASLKVTGTRKRLDDDGVRELKAHLAARTGALEKLRENRAAQIAKLDAAVKTAGARHEDALPGEVEAAKAALEEAKASREVAIREYDARVAGVAGEVEVLKAQVAQGETLNSETERQPGEQAAAEKQVEVAKARLAAVEQHAANTKAKIAADAEAAGARIADAEAAERIAETRLAMTTISSPIAGRVLRVFARPGETVGPAGVAEVADLSKMTVEAEVSVADISRVKIGAGATIRVPGLERTFSGKVARIGLRAAAGSLTDENPAAFKDLRVIPVTITLDDAGALADHTSAQVFVRIAND